MFHVKHLFLQNNYKNIIGNFYNISPLSISVLELKIRIYVSLVIINKICKLTQLLIYTNNLDLKS